jgi:hypothetical protein
LDLSSVSSGITKWRPYEAVRRERADVVRVCRVSLFRINMDELNNGAR